MRRTILITGHKGLIGTHLKEHFFCVAGDDVIGIGRETWGRIKENKETFSTFLHKQKLFPDVIIHCAGEIYNESNMFDTNVELTKQILDYVVENSNVEMINISSSSIYGKVGYPTSERDIIVPQDIYSTTKGIGSIMSIGYGRRYNLKITDVRPYSIYGVGEKSHKLLPSLFRAFTNNEPMVLSDGMHDWTYIEDFLEAIDKIISKKDKPFGDIVNIGSGIETSNFDVYMVFAKYFGFDSQAVTLNHDGYLRERDTRTWCCNNRYSKEFYDIEYKYTVENGIFKMIDKLTEKL